MARRTARVVSLVFVLTGFSFSAMSAPLTVTVSKDHLTIDGVTRGSAVAVLGVAHERDRYMTRVVVRRELLADDANAGRIDYTPTGGIAYRSIWIVTEMQTGETVVAGPPGFNPLQMTQKGAGRGNPVNVTANLLDIGRDCVDILVVRPGRGAWTFAAREKGTEASTVPGRLRIDLSRFRPLKSGFGAPPDALTAGDIVIVADIEQMEYWWTKTSMGGR